MAKRREPEDDERVSLADLDPEEALRALLKVDPESEPVKPTESPAQSSDADQQPQR